MILTITIRFPGRTPAPAATAAAPGGHLPAGVAPAGTAVTGAPVTPGTSAGPGPTAGLSGTFRTVLPIIEPAALLLAEAAGIGLLGQIVCATALRSARHVLAA